LTARTAERRCAAIIANLDIPRPFDLPKFLSQIATRRNRPIFLHPFTSGPGTPCGLWLRTARADHIFHEKGTTPWHRTHIALHEIAHMLLGHDSGQSGTQGLAELLAPDVNPALLQLVLGRSSYTSAEECDAETLASLVLGHATASPGRHSLPFADTGLDNRASPRAKSPDDHAFAQVRASRRLGRYISHDQHHL
jgi:hypothetical protein